jgi:hypothetical protein
MGVANRDASLLTQKRRNMAENAYYNGWKAAVNAGGNAALTGPAKAGAEVLSEIKLGCTACTIIAENGSDPNKQRYPTNVSSGKNTGVSP